MTIGSILDDGGTARAVSAEQLHAHLERIAQEWILDTGVSRLLLLPPDHTRLHSHAGEITAWLWHRLAKLIDVSIMPTVGTHSPMTRRQCARMFGDGVPFERIHDHRWREDLTTLGTLGPGVLDELSRGRFRESVAVQINRKVVSGEYDLVLSIGQVVPHEVIGMANYTKNVCIGAGGKDVIHKSHYLGAVCGMETIMGRGETPVRQLVDRAFHEFVKPRADVRFLLTVIEDRALRGFFAGVDAACFHAAAELSARVNIKLIDEPIERCVVRLSPDEFSSTWLGNKAIYRTRMAMADHGRLIIVGPGVRRFGEDSRIDALIRQYGYRGRDATMAAVESDRNLRANLAAAAHLIHGSSEGRFRVTYCPAASLTQTDVEAVGYEFGCRNELAARYRLEYAQPGWNDDADGHRFYYIDNPGLGLWSTRQRFETV